MILRVPERIAVGLSAGNQLRGVSEIGQQLVVSPHTIERHVENILDGLHLSSRIDIAVWMVEHARG